MNNQLLISLDVEEFDLPREFGSTIDDQQALAVSLEGLIRVIELFDSLGIASTCFTTAYFALNNRTLIRSIAARHEMACHSYYHNNQPQDLSTAKSVLEDIAGIPVIGYRQPRLGDVSPECLLKAGFIYDSSLNPIWLPGRYMNLSKLRLPFREDQLWILPISASPVIRYPLFWLSFKNSPIELYKAMTAWTIKWDGYLNIYFHPWEFADLSSFDLPFYIKRHSGKAMLNRLRDFLLWLKSKGAFLKAGQYVERVLMAGIYQEKT